MFIGHFALAFAAKKAAPKTSLGTFFMATQWLDFMWPLFLMLGAEHFRITPGITKVTPFDFYDFPLSHSLVMALVWAGAFGLIYLILKNNVRSAVVLAALVASHWVLDLIVHRKEMPVFLDGPYWGLGLWNSRWGTILVEGGLFIAGVLIYLKSTKPRDKVGKWGLWTLIVLLILLYAVNFFGPAQPPAEMVDFLPRIALELFALLVAWAYWVDHHRKPV